ncbi:UNVERIFIED_CONTAM: hypothetical protein PYX00_001794 [Menopon gallinae]|uniref:Uncharacterized protein n=1 Tax=Menopon gallinae TaxID=328185 RepID=A0AAW2IET9_9NEOP
MAAIRFLWECMFGPRLYKIYGDSRYQGLYEPNGFEHWGDQVISSLYVMWNVGLYTSPVIATVLYRKGYFVIESLALFTKLLIGLGVILTSSYCIRGIGRMNNPAYVTFYEVLIAAKKTLNRETKKELCKYDFEFSEWPVEFRWSDVEGEENKARVYVDQPIVKSGVVESVLSFPCRFLSYIVAHTFGIKMVYPGSVRTLQSLMFSTMLQGRIKLIEEYSGERFKLRSRDGNDIDAMFIDRRDRHANGSTLVICCEGNAGFYELGISLTPIEAKYSVLGWNHPGFGGSTGTPYPSQEQNAIDLVMQFAIHHLGFMPENIMLFGWSIGGYTASWAAMNYPDIKGMILDATFDDILQLAISRMPSSWEPLVRRTIRDYINLNVYEQVCKYNGPVTFIRRTEDEIICTVEGDLSTNRGNHLVAKFLRYRYPRIFDEKRQILLNTWLASDRLQQSLLMDEYGVNRDVCNNQIGSFIEDNSLMFPMQIGENLNETQKNRMALFLIERHITDFAATHGALLPVPIFQQAWFAVYPLFF